MILDDLAHNEPQPIIGLIDYMLNDCQVPLDRLITFTHRNFNIPIETIRDTLNELEFIPTH